MKSTTLSIAHTFKIKTHPRTKWGRTTLFAAIYVGVIGIGAALDSAAMQWGGFIVIMTTVAALAVNMTNAEDRLMSIDEAKAKIAEIEANEIKPIAARDADRIN